MPPALSRPPPRPLPLALAIAPLAIAETLFWAAYYYSFHALLPAWEADLGWTRAEISGAFTAALVITGVLAPQAGRLIDRGRSRQIFVGAGLAGAALLVLMSQVTELWQFWAVWLALGVVNAMCLYEACFAIITVAIGAKARQAITVVTLFAGFASSVSFPALWALTEALGWRGAVQVFAGLMVAVAVPLALLGFRWMAAHRTPPADVPKTTGQEGRAALGSVVFWCLAIGFATRIAATSRRPPSNARCRVSRSRNWKASRDSSKRSPTTWRPIGERPRSPSVPASRPLSTPAYTL